MGLLTRFFGQKETVEEMKAPSAPSAPPAPIAGASVCPRCLAELRRTKGSPVSPYLDQYVCVKCNFHALICGNTACDGYLTPEEMGYVDTVRYNCVKCGWSGTGTRY